MVKAFIDKLFKSKEKTPATSTNDISEPTATVPRRNSAPGVIDLTGFVEFVVKSLVDFPDQVMIERFKENEGEVIKINCAKDDIRKVIGKNGKTINSIRALVRGAGRRSNQYLNVIVAE